MLCVKLAALASICATTLSGGVSRAWAFDPADFDFTQAAPAAPTDPPAPYTVIDLVVSVSPVNTGKMYPIQFNKYEAEYTYKQSRKGRSVKYEHQFQFTVSDIGQTITSWNHMIDSSYCCGGIGLIIQLNSGRILVIGEKIVNGDPVMIKLELMQDGSSGTSGKLFDDANQQDTILKGDYYRGPIEFTGGLAAITALE